MRTDPLNEARDAFLIWDREPGSGKRKRRRVRDELEVSAPVPDWVPDPVVWFGDVAELEIVDARGDRYLYKLPDARLVLDYESGTLLVLNYTAPRGVVGYGTVGDLRRETVQAKPGPRYYFVPEYLPDRMPVVGRVASIVYLSDKYDERRPEPYRHSFGPKWRPFLAVDRRGALALVGRGFYDLTNRGLVDGSQRRDDDESLVLAEWPDAVA